MKVAVRLGSVEGTIWEGEGHGWKDGRMAGCMRWEREGRTDSCNKMWLAPESARMGEGAL